MVRSNATTSRAITITALPCTPRRTAGNSIFRATLAAEELGVAGRLAVGIDLEDRIELGIGRPPAIERLVGRAHGFAETWLELVGAADARQPLCGQVDFRCVWIGVELGNPVDA